MGLPPRGRIHHEEGNTFKTTVTRLKTMSFILKKVHVAALTSRSRDGRRLATLLPAEDVNDVDFMVGVFSAYVGPHVWCMLRTEGTVRAVESRRLAARKLEMMLEIVTPIEGSTASRTVKHLLASLPLGLMDWSIHAASASRIPRRILAFWKMQTSYWLAALIVS